MSRWLLVIPLLWANVSFALQHSVGALSEKEASFHWSQGESAFQKGQYQEAVNHLQRLVERYPGKTGFIQAHFYLGKALLELGKPREAIEKLKYFISSTRQRSETPQAYI